MHTWDTLLEEEANLCCPVTLEPMRWPILCSDTHTYEFATIIGLLKTSAGEPRSPLTREPIDAGAMIYNRAVARQIECELASHGSLCAARGCATERGLP